METIPGLALIAIFLATVVLIVRGQSPLVMLLALAILWALFAGVSIGDIQSKIVQGGGVQFASAVVIIIFGAWFAQILVQTGIAESVILSAVELAGGYPLATAMTVTLVTALLFTSMYGVGGAIAIGVIALPIMAAQGIPREVAAPVFTMGIGAGVFVNLTQFGIFQKLFPGIVYRTPWLAYWAVAMTVYVVIAWIMAYVHLRKLKRAHGAKDQDARDTRVPPRMPYYTYVVPVMPVLMTIAFNWEIIPTFLISIVTALIVTAKGRRPREHFGLFVKAFYDAFPGIATVSALWTICGMVIVAGQTPEVSAALKPVLAPILPHTALAAALFFGLLGGICNIYRGPLAVVGTGAAVVAILLANREIPINYLHSLWLAPTVVQGSIDPTNSWTLWTISYTKTTHGEFLKTALPFGLAMVLINSIIAYFMLS
ncbi:MAG: hypothetical protein JOY67_12885 [Hyphomicrobiales bacterium]|nr:hypothetical protein [Hyphomicrobiales bacterium]MBV9517726.1 hypothetical protein [Hyphomicrobiales bacterium]